MDTLNYRPLDTQDIPAVLSLFRQDDMLTFTGVSEGMTDVAVAWWIHSLQQSNAWVQAIIHKDEFCGIIGVDEPGNRCADNERDLYYWIATHAQGHGVATRAVSVAVNWVLETDPLVEAIVATVRLNNYASIRVLEKSDFIKATETLADDRYHPRHRGKPLAVYRRDVR